jgi:hypothetical protein
MTATITTILEAAILEDIASGLYDKMLPSLEKAVSERLIVARSERDVTGYGIGDRVKFNSYCGTQYLRDREAVVVGIKKKKLMVRLEKPVGRFVRYVDGVATSVDISVPPSIVDLVL